MWKVGGVGWNGTAGDEVKDLHGWLTQRFTEECGGWGGGSTDAGRPRPRVVALLAFSSPKTTTPSLNPTPSTFSFSWCVTKKKKNTNAHAVLRCCVTGTLSLKLWVPMLALASVRQRQTTQGRGPLFFSPLWLVESTARPLLRFLLSESEGVGSFVFRTPYQRRSRLG